MIQTDVHPVSFQSTLVINVPQCIKREEDKANQNQIYLSEPAVTTVSPLSTLLLYCQQCQVLVPPCVGCNDALFGR